MPKILISYVRNDKGQRVGTVVAIPKYDYIDTHLGTFAYPVPSSVSVGFSRWNPKDKYDKYQGIYVAICRALKQDRTDSPYYERMKRRAEKYFLKSNTVTS